MHVLTGVWVQGAYMKRYKRRAATDTDRTGMVCTAELPWGAVSIGLLNCGSRMSGNWAKLDGYSTAMSWHMSFPSCPAASKNVQGQRDRQTDRQTHRQTHIHTHMRKITLAP